MAKEVRDKSFSHLDSDKLSNIAQKRYSMMWSPTIGSKIQGETNHILDCLIFGDLEPRISVNGNQFKVEKSLKILNLDQFISELISQSKDLRSQIIYHMGLTEN